MSEKLDEDTIQLLNDMANRLRIHAINAIEAAKSGHPTSCSSCAEILSVLFYHVMHYMPRDPLSICSDRFVLSKGHAAPILYAAWAEAGTFPVSDLLNLRKIDSDLEGHPTPRLPFIDVGTGSLGQGLSIACGMAISGKNYEKASYRVYCLIGDGESAEGSVWEALSFASYYKLDNLCVIFDINRLGQSEPTSIGHNIDTYYDRVKAFGFHVISIDGHNVADLVQAFKEAESVKEKPTAILCKTIKGKNFPGIEDMEDWHGKPLLDKAKPVIEHLESLIKYRGPVIPAKYNPKYKLFTDAFRFTSKPVNLETEPNYKIGDLIAPRVAYGTALVKLAQNDMRITALDGDTKNSTFSDQLKKYDKNRYIECFIAEQNLVGVAIGTACRENRIPFVSTFAAFLTRAFDQLRMGAISQANITCVGSHCGVSIGEDGPSQMALEDIAMFRTIPGSTIFYPSDAVSTERAVELAANAKGISFIRTSRPPFPVIYKNDETFEIGKHKIVKKSHRDECLVIAAGVTLHEALACHDELMKNSGINIRVMDLFSIKPLDSEFFVEHTVECGGKIVTVEDHYPQGGIGEAVAAAIQSKNELFHVKSLSVNRIPRSGPSQALLRMYGIDRNAIRQAVLDLVKEV